jgi:4-amino-4-deoxy-L-arabinose transferase-like glycosyltransferase
MHAIAIPGSRKVRVGQEWLIIASLALLVILLRLPSLEQPIDNNGGARAYHAQLILAGEPLYGTHHPGHHLPGIYYTYALALWLFGNSTWAIKLLVIPVTIAAVWLMYGLAFLLFGRFAAILAATFYALLTSHIWLFGTTATTELFANVPRIGAFLLLLYFLQTKKPAWYFIFVGLLSAGAFLYKAVYLSPLVLTAIVLLAEVWQQRHEPAIGRAMLRRGMWTAAGFLALLAPVVLYFAGLNLLPRVLLLFAFGQEYVNNPDSSFVATAYYWPIFPLFGLAMNNVALFTLAAVAIWLILRQRQGVVSPARYVAAWFFLSFIEAGINRSFFLHYYLLIVPPLVLLAAWFLAETRNGLLEPARKKVIERRAAVSLLLIILAIVPFSAIWPNYRLFLPLLILLGAWLVLQLWRAERPQPTRGHTWLTLTIFLSLFLSFEQNANYYTQYARYKLGAQSFDDFLRHGWPEAEAIFLLQQVITYIDEHTEPEDKVFYWSEKAHFYYLSGQRSPVDVIWPIYVGLTGPKAPIFEAQTKYIIVDTTREPPPPAWLYEGLSKKYLLESVIGGQEIYRRQ